MNEHSFLLFFPVGTARPKKEAIKLVKDQDYVLDTKKPEWWSFVL